MVTAPLPDVFPRYPLQANTGYLQNAAAWHP